MSRRVPSPAEHREGWQAAGVGLTRFDNPYPPGPRHSAWEKGFLTSLRCGKSRRSLEAKACGRQGCDGLVFGADRKYCTPECSQAARRNAPQECARPGCTNIISSDAKLYCSTTCVRLHRPKLEMTPQREAVLRELKRARMDRKNARVRQARAAARPARGQAPLPVEATAAKAVATAPPVRALSPPHAEPPALIVSDMMRRAVARQFSAVECRLAGLTPEQAAWVAEHLAERRRAA